MRALLTTATRLRLSIAAVVLVVNALLGRGGVMLPWVLLVAGLDVVVGFVLTHEDVLLPHRTRRAATTATAVAAVCAGLSLIAGPGALPLLVIPLYRAGERRGRGALTLTAVALAIGAGTTQAVEPARDLSLPQVMIWVALAVSLGVLAAWEARIDAHSPGHDPVADEASVLLERLTALAAGLEGGLDQTVLAELILAELPDRPGLRAVVLAGPTGETAVPIALRGASRVPWPQSGPAGSRALKRAWAQGEPGHDLVDGRGVVAVPIVDAREQPIGMLVADWPATTAPTDLDIAAVAAPAADHGVGLAVALAYARLREQAGIDERRQLARAMHDGIAQEIAALGFHLDMARYAAEHAGDSVAGDLAGLRAEVARILADLRNDITDLRVGLRPERGLGAAVSARVQQFGATTGTVVTVVLRETGFRLPAATEVTLYRVVLDVLADAQRHRAKHLVVRLVVAAPQVDLSIDHDAPSGLTQERLRERLGDLGCALTVNVDNGLRVHVWTPERTPAQGLAPAGIQRPADRSADSSVGTARWLLK